MKKIALATVAAAALAASGGAYAYTSGTFSNGFVVPNVIHNGSTENTAVGIINRSGSARGVYWTFFDENSVHVTDGCVPLTQNQYYGFDWMNHSGVGLENQRGYLVFAAAAPETTGGGARVPACSEARPTLDAGEGERPGAQLSANAFFINSATDDVAFTPVIDGDLTLDSPTADLTTLNADSLVSVAGAAQRASSNDELHMRYTIGGGDTTRILVWSTGDHSGTHTVNIYDDDQNRKSVNFELDNAEQDWFDPASINGRPAGFNDGFIVWDAGTKASANGPSDTPNVTSYAGKSAGSIYAVSYASMVGNGFLALQTLLAAHR